MKKLAAAAVMLSVLLAGLPVQAAGNYTIDCNGKKIATPETHIVEKTITTLDGGGALTNPQDIFIDAQDNIYVADTGNNRIVVLDSQGRYLRSYTAGNSLRSPSGVYVAEFGSLFVADTGNERIVNINPDDTVAEVFTKPDSDMLTESSDFAVTKVCLSAQGFLYTLKGQQFMMIDADNQFKGFVGANYLPFSLKRVFVRLFATEEQKQKLEVEEAPPYTNFMIGHDGMLYAVAATSLEKIKKLNVSGKNVFPADYTTEQLYDSDGLPVDTNFVDITVDDHDVISVLEQTSGRIYQYDQEGNLLSVFGGLGDKRGYFRIPVSIAADSQSRLYVLDSSTGYIHVFAQTTFMEQVADAVQYYTDGQYQQAHDAWSAVAEIDVNYPLANRGIGQTLYKMGKTDEALEYLRVSNDRQQYGVVFNEWRYDFVRQNFLWVLLAVAAVLAAVIFLVVLTRRAAKKAMHRYYFSRKGD